MLGRGYLSVLAQAHKHISEFEDQDEFDNAFYKLHRERNQTLLQFANVARAPFLKLDANGYLLPDPTRGIIFLRQAKIGILEDHIMAKTNGSRNFPISSMPSRRPMSQVSSSFPSYDDATTLSTTMSTAMSAPNPRTMMVSGSTCLASLRTPGSKSRFWPVCWRISRRAEWGRARVSEEARKAGARVSPVVV